MYSLRHMVIFLSESHLAGCSWLKMTMAQNHRFNNKENQPTNVLAIENAAAPNRSASRNDECRTCGSSDHISNRCTKQKTRCFQFDKDGKCEYAERCKFRHLQVDEVLSVGDYQSLEKVTEESWRDQQDGADEEDPGNGDAMEEFEDSMQSDTAAAIIDGDESKDDFDLDYGFEELEDTSEDD